MAGSTVDLYSFSEEVINKAEEAIIGGYGRFDTRWGKWSRTFNLGIQAASSLEPRAARVFTLWVLVSQCVEAKFRKDSCSSEVIGSMRDILEDVGASDLSPRVEELFG